MIDLLNRRLVARSVFREGLDDGFHEESAGVQPVDEPKSTFHEG